MNGICIPWKVQMGSNFFNYLFVILQFSYTPLEAPISNDYSSPLPFSPQRSCPVHIPPNTFPQILIELNDLFSSLGLALETAPLHKSKNRYGRVRLVPKGEDEGEKGNCEEMLSQ